MWVKFNSIEFKEDMKSKRTGNTYSGWVLDGTKMGYKDEPDVPYSKVFFDNQVTTVIERGVRRPNVSIVQFLRKAVQPGDIVEIRNVRNPQGTWDVVPMENKAQGVPEYEPLSDEEHARMQAAQTTEQAAAQVAQQGYAPAPAVPQAPAVQNEVPF